jgi:hypothetical protein
MANLIKEIHENFNLCIRLNCSIEVIKNFISRYAKTENVDIALRNRVIVQDLINRKEKSFDEYAEFFKVSYQTIVKDFSYINQKLKYLISTRHYEEKKDERLEHAMNLRYKIKDLESDRLLVKTEEGDRAIWKAIQDYNEMLIRVETDLFVKWDSQISSRVFNAFFRKYGYPGRDNDVLLKIYNFNEKDVWQIRNLGKRGWKYIEEEFKVEYKEYLDLINNSYEVTNKDVLD